MHFMLGLYYANANELILMGMQQDWNKANELYLKAGELGCAMGYNNLGLSYHKGTGVEVDKRKANHFYELAAMKGDVGARYNLAISELGAGNHQRAAKHFTLAAKRGDKESLDEVKVYFMKGVIKKDEYANTLRAYLQRLDEVKSEMRDKAKASGHFQS